MAPLTYRYVAMTDVGLRRSNNQDSGYASPHLLVIAQRSDDSTHEVLALRGYLRLAGLPDKRPAPPAERPHPPAAFRVSASMVHAETRRAAGASCPRRRSSQRRRPAPG